MNKALFFLLVLMLFASAALAKAPVNKTLRIGVLDTGLDLSDPRFQDVLCPKGHRDFTGTGIEDSVGHGTHVAGIIKEVAGKGNYCLVILKYFDYATHKDSELYEKRALEYAAKQKIDIINLSGEGSDFDEVEFNILTFTPKMLLIGAVGNGGKYQRGYPGCLGLSNTRCVGSAIDGVPVISSNYGPWVNVWQNGVNVFSTLPNGKMGYMSGTSMATAIETGTEIRRRLNNVRTSTK